MKAGVRRFAGLPVGVCAFALTILWLSAPSAQVPSNQTIFGPKKYVRTTGAPNQFDDRFNITGPLLQSYALHVVNGDSDGSHRVSSASIAIGDLIIVRPEDLSKQIGTIDRTIVLTSYTTLHVSLASEPGSYFTVSILGQSRSTDRGDERGNPGKLVVDAGPDQTIVLPASAALTGSAKLQSGSDDDHNRNGDSDRDRREAGHDDGERHDGDDRSRQSGITVVWSKVSGPGAVTFVDAFAAASRASFGAPGTYVLRLTGNDGRLVASDDVTIIVRPAPPVNQAPVVSAGPAQTITLPNGATLAGGVSDDGLPVGAMVTSTWTVTSGAGSVVFQNAASPTTTATFGQAGTYVLRLTASDTQLSTFSETTITVNAAPPPPPVNQPPVVSAGPAQTITLSNGATLAGGVSDDGLPVGAMVTSTWTVTSGAGSVVFQNAASPTTTATFGQAGTYVLRLTASDTQLSTFSETTITVNAAPPPPPVNQPPVVSAGPAQTITLPNGATLAGSVSDDGLPVGAMVTSTWTVTRGPGSAVFQNASSPSTTVTFGQSGVYVLRLTASDTQLTAFSETTITVKAAPPPPPVNQPPVVSAGPAQTITLPNGVTLAGSVSDDGLPVGAALTSTWSVVTGSGSVVFQNAASPTTTATFGQAGTYVLRLTASDTQLTAFSETTITVNAAPPPPPVNQAPVVSAGPAQTITLPNGVTLAGSVSDDGLPVGAPLTSTWSVVSGAGSVVFQNAGSPTTTATFGQAGTYVLRLTASDTQLTAFSETTITVNAAPPPPPVNQPPVVSAGPAQTITLPNGVTLAGSVSDDGLPVGATVTSTWTVTSGPGSVVFQNASSPTTTVTFGQAGAYVLRLTASDTQLTNFSETTITVIAANVPPIAVAGGPYSGLVGQTIAFNGTQSSDPDNDPLSYSWTFGDGAIASGPTPTHAYSSADRFSATLTVSDGRGGTNTSTAFVTITQPNRPPVVSIGGPYSGSTRSAITFAASVSDPDGDPVTVSWDFGEAGATGIGASSSHLYASPGTYTVRVTGIDSHNASASDTASVSVVIVNGPPSFTSSPTTAAKHKAPYSYQLVVVDPDGDAVTFSLTQFPTGMTVDSQTGLIQWTPTGDQFGDQPVTVVATDTFQARATQSFTISVVDATSPVVTLALPAEALPGAVVTATAAATDNVGVASVTFEVNGADPTVQVVAPFQRSISVPQTALAGTEFHVRATARDAAGNAGVADATFKVAATPDVQPPIVSLNAPPNAAPGSAIHLTATSTDNVGVKSVTFKIADTVLQVDGDAPYEATYTVPADAAVGTTLSFSARATDYSNNIADASASVAIVAAPDTSAPHVQLLADATVAEGGTLALSATADDDVGVAEVVFAVNGVTVGTASSAPYAASYALPPTVTGGDVLHLEARAVDFAGNVSSSAVDATVVSAPNRPPTAAAGGPYTGEVGDAIQLDASASSDPDERDRLTFDWNFGDSSTGSGRTPLHAYASEGTYTVTLTVSDGHGGSSSASASVVVIAASDRAPPSIVLTGPSSVLPGTQVTMTAQASDNKGVVAVAFDVNGADQADTTTPPYQRVVNVPAVANPGDVIKVRAVARDAAGNTASAEASLAITGVPDTQKPSVTLNAPPQVAAGAALHLSALANDNVGVGSVAFVVNGVALATLLVPPYEALYPVPADAVPGSSIGVVVQATDFGGNQASAEAAVHIAQTSDTDTTPPNIRLTAPLQVFAGKQLSLSAAATDNVGVAGVVFFVDGTNVGTVNAPPYAVTVPLGSSQVAGSVLKLLAKAVDYSGLEASDTAQALVVSTTAAGQGSVTGQVYDDTTSLPIAGADIRLIGQDSTGSAYTQTTTTDARGRWALNAVEGQGVVQISKTGWTRVDRPAQIAANQAVELFDGRLTPVGTATQTLSAVLGGSIATNGAALTLTPGALATATAVTLTTLSSQGLEGVLPPGWSPVGAADVLPHGLTFSVPAALSLPSTFSVTAATPLAVATWDEQARAWRAIGSISAAQGSGLLVASIPTSGQYALLLGDAAPSPPPAAVPGTLLSGVSLTSLDVGATTVVDPQPRILFYKPGVRSDVHGAITTPAAASSGLPIETRLTESYQFLDGSQLHPEPFVEDLFFYQTGVPTPGVSGVFTVTPSQTFDPLTLQLGTITVELLAPPIGQRLVTTLGSDGGSVASSSGEALQLPQGAIASPLPISVRGLTAGTVGVAMPTGVDLVGAVLVSFSGSLAKPAAISVPKPAGAVDASRLLVVRADEIGGQTKLVLVARALVLGTQLVSDTTLGTTAGVLEGVRLPGRYLFIRTAAPVGFATGTVTNAGGAVAGALVSPSTLPVVALSNASGRYVAAAATGAVTLTATDLQKADAGTSTGTIASAGAVASIDIAILAAVPVVTSIAPADGSANVPLSTPVVIRFSRAIDPATVNGANAGSVVLTGPDGVPIAASVSLGSGNGVLTLRPSAALSASTAYTITIGTSVADVVGRHLASPVVAHFTSFDTAPPPTPPAGSIAASIPGADGFTTITATQGTAGTHDTVTVVNVTQKTTTPVLVDPSGGFTVRVATAITDKLQIAITGQNGSQTVVGVPVFKQINADGSVSQSVTAAGGHVDGPAGTAVDVPQGAFPSGAVVTIKSVTASQFPVTLTAEQQSVFGYAGGFQLDFGGAVPTHYINVSIPPQIGDTADDQWIVSQVLPLNGKTVLNMVDTAKLINGRITTSSPPCPGVTAAAVYGIHKSSQLLGIAYTTLAPADSGLTAVVQSSGNGFVDFLVPYIANVFAAPTQICLPTLTGRVTVTQNKVDIVVPFDQIAPTDTALIVTNEGNPSAGASPAGAQTRFTRDQMHYVFEVAGSVNDSFDVSIETNNGSRTSTRRFALLSGPSGKVDVSVDVDAIAPDTASVIITNNSTPPGQVQIEVFTGSTISVRLRVAGGVTDLFDVTREGSSAGSPATFTVEATSSGPGNLVLRAVDGTFAPNQAEIDAYNAANPGQPIQGHARTKVELIAFVIQAGASVDQTTYLVPESVIVNGGTTYTFNGNPGTRYRVEESFQDQPTETFDIPRFEVNITDDVGETVKTVLLPAPPKNDPEDLGTISTDHTPPALATQLSSLLDFDPGSDILTLRFSEGITTDSIMKTFSVWDGAVRVPGTISISDHNQAITFVPQPPFQLGKTYKLSLSGLRDAGGNSLPTASQQVKLDTRVPQQVTSFATSVAAGGPSFGLASFQVLTDPGTGNTGQKVTLVAATDSMSTGGYRVVTIDESDPANPQQIGFAFGGFFKDRIVVVQGVNALLVSHPFAGTPAPHECPPATATFSGDIALTTTNQPSEGFSFIQFYDVTNRAAPCLMGGKVLRVDPDKVSDFDIKGTIHDVGLARGIAALKYAPGHIAVYTAIPPLGLTITELGANIPELAPADRQPDTMLPGNYRDVATTSDHVLAINGDTRQLEILDSNLSSLSSIDLNDDPFRLLYVPRFPFDANFNGTIDQTTLPNGTKVGESIDIVVIGCRASIVIVDITDVSRPRIVGRVPTPVGLFGQVLDLDVDRKERRLLVAANGGFMMIDLSQIDVPGLVDQNHDGIDDRIVWRQMDTTARTAKFDQNGFIYLGDRNGVQTWFAGPRFRGTAQYRRFDATTSGLRYTDAQGNNAGHMMPIRGAIVELQDSMGAVLQTTNTDENGIYIFNPPALGTDVKVVVKAMLGQPSHVIARVVDNTSNNHLYTAEAAFTYPSATGQENIQAEAVWDPNAGLILNNQHVGAYTTRTAAPFAVLDTVYQVEQALLNIDTALTFSPVDLAWSELNNTLDGDPKQGQIETTHFHYHDVNAPDTIYVLGQVNHDTDEYDETVIAHEWVHYFTNVMLNRPNDDRGGDHGGDDVLDPANAFSEGFATAFGMMLLDKRSSPLYIDTQGDHQADPVVPDNLEDDHNNNGGFFSEESVYQVLWDLFDRRGQELDQEDPVGVASGMLNGVDSAMVPLAKLYAAANDLKSSAAYLNLVTYLYFLRNRLSAAEVAQVDQVAAQENIDLAGVTEFDVATTKPIPLAANGLKVGPVYIGPLPITDPPTVVDTFSAGQFAGLSLHTSLQWDPNRDGNKWYERVYYRFTVPTPDLYQITVTPTSGQAVRFELNQRGVTYRTSTTATLGAPVTLTLPLKNDDYTGAVSLYGADGRLAQGTFTIGVRRVVGP